MSSVYRAHDRVLERTVALKVLHQHYSDDDEYVERFRREARMAARLSHPNIVTRDRPRRGTRAGSSSSSSTSTATTSRSSIERDGPLPVERALELGDPDRAARSRSRTRTGSSTAT